VGVDGSSDKEAEGEAVPVISHVSVTPINYPCQSLRRALRHVLGDWVYSSPAPLRLFYHFYHLFLRLTFRPFCVLRSITQSLIHLHLGQSILRLSRNRSLPTWPCATGISRPSQRETESIVGSSFMLILAGAGSDTPLFFHGPTVALEQEACLLCRPSI
jgi:hypothetical protein